MSKDNYENFVLDVVFSQFDKKTSKQIIEKSLLIQYLVIKTKSVNGSSKSRSSDRTPIYVQTPFRA